MADSSFVNPERVVSYLDIRKGSVIADFGCGAGYYTLPLARKAGIEGKVYAFDIRPEAASMVRSRAVAGRLLQVEAVTANLEASRGTRLKDSVVDLVLMSSLLHQADDKEAPAKEAFRILKPGGSLAVIEWDTAPSPAGPEMAIRLPKAKAKELCERAGFLLDREFEAGSYHYGLLFKKP